MIDFCRTLRDMSNISEQMLCMALCAWSFLTHDGSEAYGLVCGLLFLAKLTDANLVWSEPVAEEQAMLSKTNFPSDLLLTLIYTQFVIRQRLSNYKQLFFENYMNPKATKFPVLLSYSSIDWTFTFSTKCEMHSGYTFLLRLLCSDFQSAKPYIISCMWHINFLYILLLLVLEKLIDLVFNCMNWAIFPWREI